MLILDDGNIKKIKYRSEIQALRGIAVLLVVLYHVNFPGLDAGYLGVDLFFVISGFLITGIIGRGLEEGRFTFKEFYFRRAKRLLPAAYVVILLTVLLAPFFLSQFEIDDLKYQVMGAVTFTINGVLWLQSGYFDGAAETKPLLHFWSLSIEEQYYLFLPLFLFLTPARHWIKAVVFIGASSFVLSLYMSVKHPDASFYLLPTRVWEFALGSVCALASLRKLSLPNWLNQVAVLAILLVSFFPTGFPHPGLDSLIVCSAVVVILIAKKSPGILSSESSTGRFLARIGDLSYSLYLVHWPVIVFFRSTHFGEPSETALGLAVIVSLILSVALHQFVEEPMRKGVRVSWNAVVRLSMVSVLIFISPLAVNAGIQRLNGDYKQIFFGHVPCGEVGNRDSLNMPVCTFGKSNGKRVLLIGDSHSRQFAYGLSQSHLAESYEFLSIFGGRCLPFPERRVIRGGRVDENCLDAQYKMKEALADRRYEVVLVSGRWSIYDPITSTELEWLKQISFAPVILIGPIPDPKFQRLCLLERDECSIVQLSKHDIQVNEKLSQSVAEAGIEYIDLLEKGCNKEKCPLYINRKAVYSDANHLSMIGSNFYVGSMIEDITDRLNMREEVGGKHSD